MITHRLHVIVGSTRPDRAADKVVPWVMNHAETHGGFDVELIDLRDWPLPMFQETAATVGDPRNPTYSEPIVREWNLKMAESDAVIFVTPEYNHSIPAVLKNALDSVFVSSALRNKPAAFVGYSGGTTGAARAIEHLAQIVLTAEMAPLRNTALVPSVQQAFGEDGEAVNPMTNAALKIALDDLAWWADALTPARRAGELPTGGHRMMAARSS